jgi:tripartite ATP-independent transporter DctM subunit
MAGIVPGLVLTGMFMLYTAVRAMITPGIAPREAGPRNAGEFLHALLDLVPFIVLIGGTIGSLYLGWATPTEAAAVGCVLALLGAAIWGTLDWQVIRDSLRATVLVSGNILLITFGAFVFSYAISLGGVGEKLTGLMTHLNLTKWEFFLALIILYTVLGALVESLGMIVITVPLLYPVLLKYGIDPVWFGVVLVVFIEAGQITPPIGINLFVIQSIWNGKLGDVVLGTIPYHIIIFVMLGLLMVWPDIAMWLPNNMTGK